MRKPKSSEQSREDDAVVRHAIRILERRLRKAEITLGSPSEVRRFLTLKLADRDHEVFVALFLDTQHRLIAYEELFRGTLAQTSVYPREVIKVALRHNAGSVIFAHNHPSGVAEPSRTDEMLTNALRDALALVDVLVVDHFVVAGTSTVSFAERGLV